MTAEEELIQRRQKKKEQEEHMQLLQEQVKQRTEHGKHVQERLAKDSHKSSLPPSSDRFARQKKTRSLRKSSGKKSGGHAGHPGNTLTLSEQPETVIGWSGTHCQECHADLSSTEAARSERRQVVDVPLPRVQITEDQAEDTPCPHCHRRTRAAFPEGVHAPVHSGPRVGTMAVDVLIQQLLPWGRTSGVLVELLGVQMSEGTLATLGERTATPLEGVETQINAALRQAPVIHHDETGLDVTNRRVWMHGTSTTTVTHDQIHESRGTKALEATGLLGGFTGVSVHECWAASFRSPCHHALCLVPLVRDLTFVAEALGVWWAAKLKRLVLEMKQATDEARLHSQACLSPPTVATFTARFVQLLSEGDPVHPRVPTPAGKRGKAKQHPGRHLLDRLRTSQDAVVRFLTNLMVPFSKNLAEQDLRMVNVQQKVSGSFRSPEGALAFCRIRGDVSTLRTHGVHVFSALEATVRGHPLLPSFSVT